MSSFVEYTAPTLEPVSLDEVKSFLRLTGSDEDSVLELLIKSAREFAEVWTGRQCLTSTWDYYLDAFPDTEILLPRSPLQSVTSITYYNTGNVLTTWSSSEYTVDANQAPPKITEKYGYYWPSTLCIPNAVIVRGIYGYTAASLVPGRLRLAILQLVSHFYENRELIYTGTILSAKVPIGLESLLYSLKVQVYS